MHPFTKMKSELKALALEIKTGRATSKNTARENSAWEVAHPDCRKYGTAQYKEWLSRPYPQFYTVAQKSQEFREKHIAYCLARGRTYEQIERTVRDNNRPNWGRIDKIKTDLETAVKAHEEVWHAQQALRASAS